MSQIDTVPKSDIVVLSDDDESNSSKHVIDMSSDTSSLHSPILINSNVTSVSGETRRICRNMFANDSEQVDLSGTTDNEYTVDDAIEQDARYIMTIGSQWKHDEVIALLLANADNADRVNIVIEMLLERDASQASPDEAVTMIQSQHAFPTRSNANIKHKRTLNEVDWGNEEFDGLDMDIRSSSHGSFVPQSAINALANQQFYAPVCAPCRPINTLNRSNADPSLPGTSAAFDQPGTSASFDLAGSSVSFNQPGTSASFCQPEADGEMADKFHADVLNLTGMFPDCDPTFLRSRLEDHFEAADRVERVVEALLKLGDYPKLPDRRKKEYLASQKRERLSQIIDFGDFLRAYTNPEAHFSDTKSRVAESYKQHARAYLQAVCGRGAIEVEQALTASNYHFLSAFRTLKTRYPEQFGDERPDQTRQRGNYGLRNGPFSRTDHLPGRPKWHERVKVEMMPDTIDEQFYEELLYVRYEHDIKAELRNRQAARQCRLDELKQSNSTNWLLTCSICYDDQIFPEDVFTCEAKPNDHVFCRECMRKYVDCEMGHGRYTFRCLTGECSFEFTMRHLSALLPKKLLDRVLDKRLEADLAAANNTAIVSCPYCSYTVQIDDPNYSEIACANPACLRHSCRFCKQQSHVPLGCDEVKRKLVESEYLEKKLSESVIHVCFHCKKPYVKSDGCNMITCSCGAKQCYVCGAANIDYSHFGRGKCLQNDMQVDTNRFNEANRRITDELRTKTVDEIRSALETEAAARQEPSTNLDATINAVVHQPARRGGARGNRRRRHGAANVNVNVIPEVVNAPVEHAVNNNGNHHIQNPVANNYFDALFDAAMNNLDQVRNQVNQLEQPAARLAHPTPRTVGVANGMMLQRPVNPFMPLAPLAAFVLPQFPVPGANTPNVAANAAHPTVRRSNRKRQRSEDQSNAE